MQEVPYLAECEVYMQSVGFSKEDLSEGRSLFNSKEIKGCNCRTLRVKVYVWNGCCQVDMVSVSRKGAEKFVKNLVWGWCVDSFADIKILFEKQADLKLLATVDTL